MAADFTPEPLLVDRRTAARLLGCCDRTVDNLIREREISAIRIGRSVRIDVADLRRFIEVNKRASGIRAATH